jgi:hypothetical protein
MWLHTTRPIAFFLIVDDLEVKCMGKQDAAHSWDTLLRRYEITTYWEGKVYYGMTLKWDYKNRTCTIPMPDYVANVLNMFQHNTPDHKQHTPSRYVMLVYGLHVLLPRPLALIYIIARGINRHHLVRHLAKVCSHLQLRQSSYDIRRHGSHIHQ